ncbi:MAG TPA: hypothetical protein VMC04_19740 [Verrucomicrobiae bacterium]|nr:hypothetical protein [Verrucomicrobiae bacterium]
MSRRAEHAVWEARNARVATGLAPLLVLTGALGFALPPHLALLSGAPAYNLYHSAAGLTGMALVARAGGRGAAGFNLGFGLIDLYQAVAGAAGLFPAALFAYRPLDDVLHTALGLGLVGLGALGRRREVAGDPAGAGSG